MRSIKIIALISSFLCFVSLQAEEFTLKPNVELKETLDIKGQKEVTISNTNGPISVIESTDAQVSIRAKYKSAGKEAAKLTVTDVGGKLDFSAATPKGQENNSVQINGDGGVNIVGNGSNITITQNGKTTVISGGAGGSIELELALPSALLKTLSINSKNGDLSLAGQAGAKKDSIFLKTSNGDITCKNSCSLGSFTAESSNGSVILNSVSGEIKVISSNGSIVVTDSKGNIIAKTSNGNITLDRHSDGRVDAKTSNANIGIHGGKSLRRSYCIREISLSNFHSAYRCPYLGKST